MPKHPVQNKVNAPTAVCTVINEFVDTICFLFRKLVRALGLPQHGHYFVGLSDRASEGNWRWLNGQPASTKDVNLWWPGHPRQGSSGATADCGGMHFSFDHPSRFRAWDQPCSSKYASLCEKLIV